MAVDLLDISFYSQANPDLALAGLTTDDQLRNHFFQSGLGEGRQFSPVVNLNFYRASNPDLTPSILPQNADLYNHLSNYGVAEGRRFSPFYDAGFYKTNNADLGNLDNETVFNHLQSNGINEGRRFSALVDLNFYLAANPDLVPFFGTDRKQGLNHLELSGISEGRRFSPVLDLSFYNAASPDLRAVNLSNQGLFDHFVYNGINEGRRSSIAYDGGNYLANNPDLAGLGGFSLVNHFESFGINEGRNGSDVFNATTYLNSNPDLTAAGINTGVGAQQHFQLFGFREGRSSGGLALTVAADPGNTLSSAANLGLISNSRGGSITQQISSTDRDDYYRIVLGATSTINFSLSGFSRSLGIQLVYDRNGNGINDGGSQEEVFFGQPANTSATSFTFNRTLGMGTYYIRVLPLSSTGTFSTNYNLNLSGTITPETPVGVDPGSTLATSLSVGTLGNQTVQNYVGTTDASDIYRFNQTTAGNTTFAVSDLSGADNVRLQVITDTNNNGQIDTNEIVFTSASFRTPSNFTRNLPIGVHYLKIEQAQIISNTAYTLNLRR